MKKRDGNIRRRILALVLTAPVLVLSLGATLERRTGPKLGPRLELPSVVCDFGTSRVERLTGEFTVQNTGDEVLVLEKPTTTCGCTVASVTPTRVPPGGSGRLAFELSVGMGMRGVVEKHIHLRSNDTRQINATLTVRTVVVPLFDLDPIQLFFDELRMNDSTNATVRIQRTDGGSLAGLEVVPAAKFVTGSFEASPDGKTNMGVIAVNVTADSVPRWFNERLSLRYAGTTQEVAGVMVQGRILGDVVLSRDEIYWAVMNLDLPGTRSFRVRLSNPNSTLRIANLACTLKDVKLAAHRTPDGRGYEITVELLRVTSATTKGAITFDVNSPRQPKVTVPITINVLRR